MGRYFGTAGCVLIIIMLICSNLSGADGDMGGGGQDGSAERPYLIEDFNDFEVFRSDPNYWEEGVCTRLQCDLDLDPNLPGREVYRHSVVAPYLTSAVYFKGKFDGNNYTISNVNILSGDHYLGFFGNVTGENPEIKNLSLYNLNIEYGGSNCDFIGGICGYFGNGTIENCYVTGKIQGHFTEAIGGISGRIINSMVKNCNSNISISCFGYAGGICGSSWNY